MYSATIYSFTYDLRIILDVELDNDLFMDLKNPLRLGLYHEIENILIDNLDDHMKELGATLNTIGL